MRVAKMPGEIVQAATILAGSGAAGWFADKIFSPSVESVGNELKLYLQTRVPTIFGVAGEKLEKKGLDPQPIAPGLLARMVADASFSEQDSDITEWWANLFVDASMHSSNRHAVYSDMMAMLGPLEARCLGGFVEQFSFSADINWFLATMPNLIGAIDLARDEAVAYWVGETPIRTHRMHQVFLNLTRGELPWPLRPIRWSLPTLDENGRSLRMNQTNDWFKENREAIEILERARVFKFSKVDIPVMGPSSWVETVELTGLGAEFFVACKGFKYEAL